MPHLKTSYGLLFIIFLSACSHTSTKDNLLYRSINESIERSNAVINKSTRSLLHSLEDKQTDPAVASKAQVWYSKAMNIDDNANRLLKYIEDLKTDLKNKAGFDLKNAKFSYEENNTKAVSLLIKENGSQLFERLEEFKSKISTMDSSLLESIADEIQKIDQPFFVNEDKSETVFDHVSVAAMLVVLSRFQNNVQSIENKVIVFCIQKVPDYKNIIDVFYSAFANINPSYVRPGEKIEIMAGVGSFSRRCKPEITINGAIRPLEDDAVTHYIFKSPSKPGKYAINVQIKFTDQDGKEETITKPVEYTVASLSAQ